VNSAPNKRVLVLTRAQSVYRDDAGYCATIEGLATALRAQNLDVDVEETSLADRDEVIALAQRGASNYDCVLVRIGPEGQPFGPLLFLLEQLRDTGALYFPRLEHVVVLGAKTVLVALRDTAIGMTATERVVGREALAATVASRVAADLAGCVLKRLHGSGGRGVFHATAAADPGRTVLVHAYDGAQQELSSLELADAALGDQTEVVVVPYLARMAVDGEYRHYYTGAEPLAWCLHKRSATGEFSASRALGGVRELAAMPDPDAARRWPLIVSEAVGIEPAELPVLWSMDMVLDERGGAVASEINVVNVGLRPVPLEFMTEFARAFAVRIHRRPAGA